MSPADHESPQGAARWSRQELQAAADLVGPGAPAPFGTLASTAARRRRVRASVVSGVAVVAIVVVASTLGHGLAPRGRPAADGTPLPTPAGSPSPLTSQTPPVSRAAAPPRCTSADLAVSWSPRPHPSMPTTVYFLRFTNVSGRICAVTGYPRLHVAGPGSLHGNDVLYGTGNAALGSIPISRVALAPGHRAVSQVAFGGSIGWTGCVSPVWRVTVPGSRGNDVRLGMPGATGALLCDRMPVGVSPVYAAGHGPGRSPQSTSSPSIGLTKRQAACAEGLVSLRQFLGEWKARGLAKAARRYLESGFWPPAGQPGPKLVSGKVVDFRPTSWTSPRRFTLLVDLDLHFPGPPVAWGSWGQGRNTRFVTFTRVPGTQRYLLALATGP